MSLIRRRRLPIPDMPPEFPDSPRPKLVVIAGRVMEGGHGVPVHKIVSRYGKSIANLVRAIPIVDRAVEQRLKWIRTGQQPPDSPDRGQDPQMG